MHAAPLIAWKQAPFLRLLIPFSTGIIFQYYLHCPQLLLIIIAAITTIFIACLSNASITTLFKYKLLLGYAHTDTPRHHRRLADAPQNNIATTYAPQAHIEDSAYTYIASLQEPVTEKPNSYKAIAQLTHRLSGDSLIPFKATTILYFQKNLNSPGLYYGDKIVFHKPLQPVKAPVNPGSFNYQSWCNHQEFFTRSTWQKMISGSYPINTDPP